MTAIIPHSTKLFLDKKAMSATSSLSIKSVVSFKKNARSKSTYCTASRGPRHHVARPETLSTAAPGTDALVSCCEKILLHTNTRIYEWWVVVLALGAGTLALGLAHPESALAATSDMVGMMPSTVDSNHPHAVADIAENSDFWANVLRYVSYFFSVLLGTVYVALKPIAELLKRPTTAILVVLGAVGLYVFVSSTVTAMLGVNEFDYDPSSIVTPAL